MKKSFFKAHIDFKQSLFLENIRGFHPKDSQFNLIGKKNFNVIKVTLKL